MMFFRKILGLFKKSREDFLILEELDNRIEVVRASVDNISKKISIKSKYFVNDFSKVRSPILPVDRLVIAFRPDHATTIESVVELKRGEPKNLIAESELDALVFRGLWEFLNHYRSWTAKKMNVSEFELVLANIEINNVRLGNHKVFNPLGFSSRDFSLSIRGTFVPRTLLSTIERFKKIAGDLQIVEGPSVLNSLVAEENDFSVQAAHSKSFVFISRDNEKLFVKECPWGSVNIVGVIAKFFGVDDEVAELILQRYDRHEVSGRLERLIERLFRQEFNGFLGMLAPLYTRLSKDKKSKTRLHLRFVAPTFDSVGSNFKVVAADFHENLKREGYDIITSRRVKEFSPKLDQSALALLVYPYNRPQYSFLNQLLKRRVKWLVPNT